MTILLHPDRFNYTVTTRKLGVVVHDAESRDDASQTLVHLLMSPGDRISDSGGRYGAGYHAVTDGSGWYVNMADGSAGPFAAPPRNYDWWHVCMPGFANQTRDQWLDVASNYHIWGVARFIYDKWIEDGKTWYPNFVFADQLVKGIGGYTSHYQVSMAWHKTTHTDPGTNFPWDVLDSYLIQLINPPKPEPQPPDPIPTGDEDMELFMWQDPRYANVFVVTTATVYTVDGEVFAAKEGKLPYYKKEKHDATLFSYMRKAGLKAADMVLIGGQTAAKFPADLAA